MERKAIEAMFFIILEFGTARAIPSVNQYTDGGVT
jgi:hypothetical protein